MRDLPEAAAITIAAIATAMAMAMMARGQRERDDGRLFACLGDANMETA